MRLSQGMKLCQPQGFVYIDVSQAGEKMLVQQQGF
jgi:hypothetical protein